ncbi:TAXI family TRAP transporter solute-binding subunit [Crocosphaera sp.]|uniref:TAXI family TRAP transporter solute-binding subunit n=1 Tax=Crocosphaera sp. TaxID=2729996 RepID=UPI002607A437|nr:TAXI family TRAP transporter solute-binding subunit [Crocosphaera sp.]MDJ0578427.1 TAXI family TRAP transporter solute-binding subunit [Crocosphaera sp.]
MKESIFRKSAIVAALGSVLLVITFAFLLFEDHRKVHTLVLATGQKEGQYHAFGQALSKVVNNHNNRINIKVIESNGSQENLELLQNKDAQLALVQSDAIINNSTKAVAFLFPEVFHLIVRQDSQIDDISDLEGKRIALMSEGSGSYNMFWRLQEHYQLDIDKIKTIPLPITEAHQALENGEVDGLFRVVSLESRAVVQLLNNPQIKLIPIDQGAALQLELPALEVMSIPKGSYNGASPTPSEDLPAVGVRAVLITNKKINREIIFEITRILYEARNELVQEFIQASMIEPWDENPHLGFTFHPGALDYYNQGNPSFLVEYAEAIGLVLSVSMLLISGVWQMRSWFTGKQKNRADLYNLQLLKIIDHIQETEDLQQLRKIRGQLLAMLNEVIVDLDKDLISPESFQSFTFPWQVALSATYQRENCLVRLEND